MEQKQINFHITHIAKEAYKEIEKVLHSGFLSEGAIVLEFEKQLNSKLGLSRPLALNSGTSALHLAMILSGIKEGDEVILPAQTFIATGLSILMQNATPVFADIQENTGNIDPQSIKEKISAKTKAILPVHWGGYPCDMDEIKQIAQEHDLIVIEDAAHALGATYKNRAIGSISPFSIFSFQAIKHLSSGDGGALCCLSGEDEEKARILRWFGIDRKNSKQSLLGEREYDLKETGFKYHMNNLAAALALANLNDIPAILEKRRYIASIYRKELNKVPGLRLLEYKSDRESAYWLFTFLVENRENFIRKLKSHKIPASVVHLRIDNNSLFGGIREDLVKQAYFNEKQISIPVHQQLNNKDIELIVKTIKSGW
jgi:perosamine synthetase